MSTLSVQTEEGSRTNKTERKIKSWSPVLRSLYIIGMDTEKKALRLHNIVFLICAKILFLLLIYKIIFIIVNKEKIIELCFAAFSLSSIGISLISRYHFYIKQEKLNFHLKKLAQISANSRLNRTSLLIKVILAWIIFLIFNVCNIFAVCFKEDKMLSSWTWKFMIGQNISENMLKCFYVLIGFVHYTVLILQQNLLFLYFIDICQRIENAFNHLHGKIVTERNLKTAIPDLFITIMRLLENVNVIEDIYSPLLFLWSIQVGGNIMIHLGLLVSLDSYTWLHFPRSCTISAFSFFLFANICFCTSRISQVARMVCSSLYQASLLCDDKTQEYAFRFYIKTIQELPSFSAWKMFSVDRSLVFTLTSVIFTYILIMYQFNNIHIY